jgi:hypothetical protein
MISIAAQSNNDLLNTDSSTLKAYSRGLTDRALKIPDASKVMEKKYIAAIADKYESMSKVLSKIAQFFTTTSNVSTNTTQSSSGEYKNALRDLIQFTRNYFAVPGNGFNVIIPTKLNLTMDGLGGIIIGNLFRISDNALPKGYKGGGNFGSQLGYIVTDVTQNIGKGTWTTDIGAQTIVLDAPTGGEVWDYDKLVIDLDTSTSTNENATKVKGIVRSAYPEKPVVASVPTYIPQTQLADYLKTKVAAGLNKNVAIAVMAKSISEQGSGDQLKGFNNNFYGVQTDGSRWDAKYDNDIVGTVNKVDGSGALRGFAAFRTAEVGADFTVSNVERRGIYVGGTTTYLTKGTKVNTPTDWVRVYYKEWVRGDASAEPDAATLKGRLSMYATATKLIG